MTENLQYFTYCLRTFNWVKVRSPESSELTLKVIFRVNTGDDSEMIMCVKPNESNYLKIMQLDLALDDPSITELSEVAIPDEV